MDARRWVWLTGLLLVMSIMVAGCAGEQRSKRPEVDFTPLTLEAAPAELQEYYAETRTLPGLFVLQKDHRTYLLLMAGPVQEPGTVVEVIDIRRIGSDWRVLATLQSDAKGIEYPYAVVELQAPLDAVFKARLTGPEGEVMELKSMTVMDR